MLEIGDPTRYWNFQDKPDEAASNKNARTAAIANPAAASLVSEAASVRWIKRPSRALRHVGN